MNRHALSEIKALYRLYDGLIEEVGAEIIDNRFEKILECMNQFIDNIVCRKQLYVNERILLIALLDYYTDIKRLKSLHQHINEINDYKAKAYEIAWLLRRKPIQILHISPDSKQEDAQQSDALQNELQNEQLDYVNEQFVFSYMMSFLVGDVDILNVLTENDNKNSTNNVSAIKGFVNTLLYYLKFRNCGAQELELMLMAFDAGNVIGQSSNKVNNH